MSKKSGGRYKTSLITKAKFLCRFYNKRYFVITNEGVFYSVSQKDKHIHDVLTFDKSFEYFYGNRDTKYKYGIKLKFS